MKLSGIVVLDFSQFMPGPTLTAMLADHGARVIKVEPPTGDPTRHDPESHDDFYAACNRGKQSLCLDLKKPDGLQVALSLASRADVLVESFRPGVAGRLGLGYETLKSLNPRLIYCSVTAFGQTGPMRDLAGHDSVVQALGGSLPRERDGTPITGGVPVSALLGSMSGLAAILMALLRVRDSGVGDYIDIAMHDCLLNARPYAIRRALEHSTTSTHSSRDELAMLSAYRCADGEWLCLGGREPHFCHRLLTPLGRPDLILSALGPGGPEQRELREFLGRTFATETRDHWLDWLETHQVSAAPVLDLKQALRHPQSETRQMLIEDAHGAIHYAGALKFHNEPSTPDLHVARLGEHNDVVLAELGFDEYARAAMYGSGAIARKR
ncbi:CaiB/BaiF CoA transferase family protein [Pseudomonas citronellolis]|uniref:CaiB/BaiF CoA transferase family protein n=1 Tax=Pseudomonas citronellolis TaxID=53408 RepID=UPI0021C1048E|nr:CaiB/BaiF CoA-transferase family protein [Pseudomonas citronellolis]UXJ50271.1 CoA transferase [Pseudomonas citronellolis]